MLAFVLLALAVDQPPARVRVEGGPRVSCALRDGRGAAVERRLGSAGSEWLWHPLPGDVLHCAGDGFEPLQFDSRPKPPPARLDLTLLPARPVTLEAGWGGLDALIEWRALGVGATSVVARERATVGERLTLPVATQARAIRLHAARLSPLTVLVPAGTSPATLPLPRPRAGGEIFGRVPPHAYAPEAIEVTAQRTRRTLPVDASGFFGGGGLEPGIHVLTPWYRGDLPGPRREVVVRSGETTELLPLLLPEPGAVSVRAAAAICSREQLPARLALQKVTDGGRMVEPGELFTQVVEHPPCSRDWEGLEPGSYQVALIRSGDDAQLLSSARFSVQAGRRSEAVLSQAPVRVAGRVTYGGERPAADLVVRFELDAQVWTARTDASGAYAATLGAAGTYDVSVHASEGVPSRSFVRDLLSADERVDVSLDEAALDVRVSADGGHPLEETVHLVLTSSGGRRLTGLWNPEQDGPARFLGLPFDEYSVSARTASGLTSIGAARATLSPETPSAEVEVVLGRLEGRLEVVDEKGTPIASAFVTAGERRLAASGAGEFSLGGVPTGEWLKAHATGYVPACRELQAAELPNVRMVLPRASERVRVHVASHLPWESGRLLGIPGSDCPVEIAEIGSVTRVAHRRTTVTLDLPAGRFQLVIGSTSYPVTVPGDADVVVGGPPVRDP